MKRIIVLTAAFVFGFCVTTSVVGPGIAGAASVPPHSLTFDDSTHTGNFIIPAGGEDIWTLVEQKPEGNIIIGSVSGTSGTLTMPYPNDFCGVIQDDVYVNGQNAHYGFQHKSNTCAPGETTTTTAPPATTSTIQPPTATTQPPVSTTTVPPVITGGTTTTTINCTNGGFAGCTGAGNPSNNVPTTVPITPTLPNTGVNILPIGILGGLVVAAGVWLMLSKSSRVRLWDALFGWR